MPADLAERADAGVRLAKARGADVAEVYCSRSETVRIAADASEVLPSITRDDSVTIRVHVEGRMGVCASPSLTGLEHAIGEAMRAARGAGAARAVPFPAGGKSLSAAARAFDQATVERMTDVVTRLLRTALATSEIAYAEARYRSTRRDFAVANSTGLLVMDGIEGNRMEMELRAERGTSKRGAIEGWTGPALAADPRPESWAAEVARRARDALASEPLSGPSPDLVLLAPAPASQLLGVVAQAFSGASVAAGQSPLAKRLGERVFADGVTISDEPQGPRGARWRRFDDEGTPTSTLRLVERGVLRALLHDQDSGTRAGVPSTGHGIRKGGSGGTAPRAINVILHPGDASVGELVETAGRAVVVTEPLLGSFTSNAVTGDFSVVAPFAFLAEGGKVRHALPPTTLGGNAHEVLRRAVALGKELRVCRSATLPHVLAGGVSCAT